MLLRIQSKGFLTYACPIGGFPTSDVLGLGLSSLGQNPLQFVNLEMERTGFGGGSQEVLLNKGFGGGGGQPNTLRDHPLGRLGRPGERAHDECGRGALHGALLHQQVALPPLPVTGDLS